MPLSKTWTTVTPLSKTIAMILFIFLPFIGFSAGMRYQQKLNEIENRQTIRIIITPTPVQIHVSPNPTIIPKACAMDAKQCPNGVFVGRTGPTCEFVCPQK